MGIGKGSGRGGARKNAGRRPGSGLHGEPTVLVSVPLSKIQAVDAVINDGRKPPKPPRPYPHPIPAPAPGEVVVLKPASAQSVIAAAKRQGLKFKVVLIDPLYRGTDARGRAQFAGECIPLITSAAQIAEHMFIFGHSASLGPLVWHLPSTVKFRQWIVWYYTNVPAGNNEAWRPAHQSCLHLSKPGAKLYPKNLYRPVDLPLASFTRLKHHTRPHNVICAGNIHGNIVNRQLGTRPGEKPAKVIDVLLRMTMNPGDVVLDPTCCTGTTGEVAISNGYSALLSDRSAPALKHTALRLALARNRQAKKQEKLSRLINRWKNKAEKPAREPTRKAARPEPNQRARARPRVAQARRSQANVEAGGKLISEIQSRSIRGLSPTANQCSEIHALAREVLGSSAVADDWMEQPFAGLGDGVPAEMCRDCQGAMQVIELLMRIEYNTYT